MSKTQEAANAARKVSTYEQGCADMKRIMVVALETVHDNLPDGDMRAGARKMLQRAREINTLSYERGRGGH